MIYKQDKHSEDELELIKPQKDDTIKRTYKTCFTAVMLLLAVVCSIYMVVQDVRANDAQILDIVDTKFVSEAYDFYKAPGDVRQTTMGVLYNTSVMQMRLDPENHTVPFVTETQDLKIAKLVEDSIDMNVYLFIEFEGNRIYLDYDEQTKSYIATLKIEGLNENPEMLKGCSFFRNSDNNIVIYGFSFDGNSFLKYTVDETDSKREVLLETSNQ